MASAVPHRYSQNWPRLMRAEPLSGLASLAGWFGLPVALPFATGLTHAGAFAGVTVAPPSSRIFSRTITVEPCLNTFSFVPAAGATRPPASYTTV